ncbi:hypothetical protein MLD38_030224 [Melastoma candidum]|uniref:Uncharacterized protein n=1 Tax=Melastoma candidum TaxID=119954 RepID=A0ACB9MM86_9MYRT|nr:hypothetical protein MLD38_030224 [Melastoma candidum]
MHSRAQIFGHHHDRPFPWRMLHYFLLFLLVSLGLSIVSMNSLRYFWIRDPSIGSLSRHSITRLCVEDPRTVELDRRFSTPKNLLHSMTDEELFWRASFVPSVKTYPFKRIEKIAFMFLTKGPLPFAPLWERFFKGHEGLYSIYIHALPWYNSDFPARSVFHRRQIPSQAAEWGRTSIIDAERRLIANALLDISNEWFVLISESCIPLQNFSTVYRYISRSRYSFVGSFDEDGPYGRGRYNRKMAPLVTLSQWRKGSQWFEVDRKIALDMIEDTTYYTSFKRFCRPTCYVDEHYFATMLTIQSPHLIANRTLTWVDWTRGGAHPATFGKDDVSEDFMRKRILDNSTCTYNDEPSTFCFLFARKFAPDALDSLLAIASKVFGY